MRNVDRNLKGNIHVNGLGHCGGINFVGIEFECLFLFLLVGKECCCFGHGGDRFLFGFSQPH